MSHDIACYVHDNLIWYIFKSRLHDHSIITLKIKNLLVQD